MARTGPFRTRSKAISGLLRATTPISSARAAGSRRKAQQAHPGGVRGFNAARVGGGGGSGHSRTYKRDSRGRFAGS